MSSVAAAKPNVAMNIQSHIFEFEYRVRYSEVTRRIEFMFTSSQNRMRPAIVMSYDDFFGIQVLHKSLAKIIESSPIHNQKYHIGIPMNLSK